MASLLTLRWDGGQDWYLDGPLGEAIKFADDAAVDAFVNGMVGGTDVFMETILNQGIFPEVAAGDMDAVVAFYADYVEAADALLIAGRARVFLAADEGVLSLAECIIQAGRWLLEFFPLHAGEAKGKTITIPSDREKEDFRRLRLAMKDPQKRAEALETQKAFKSRFLAEKEEPSKVGVVTQATNPDYAQTWYNLTGGAMLELDQLKLRPESIMSVVSYPAKEFQIGAQALAWSWIASGWAQGEMDGSVVWKAPNGARFGVNVHCPVQLLGAGTAPYYEVQWSEEGKNHWHAPVTDPAHPFTFPTSLGYQIDIKTQCGHASIAVSVLVSKLKK